MALQSTYPPLDLPDTDIWEFLFERPGRAFPEFRSMATTVDLQIDLLTHHLEIFLDAETQRAHTFSSVKQIATTFGSYLISQHSWQRSDVLAFCTPNSIDVPPLVWGCHYAGGIVTTANPAYNARELEFQLKNSTAKAVVTHESCVEVARQAAKGAGIAADRVWVLSGKGSDSNRRKGLLYVDQILESRSGKSHRARRAAKSGDLAFLVYSSGTTGLPKGVMLSHGNIIANVLQLSHEGKAMACDKPAEMAPNPVVAFLPFYHIYGKTTKHNFFINNKGSSSQG